MKISQIEGNKNDSLNLHMANKRTVNQLNIAQIYR